MAERQSERASETPLHVWLNHSEFEKDQQWLYVVKGEAGPTEMVGERMGAGP